MPSVSRWYTNDWKPDSFTSWGGCCRKQKRGIIRCKRSIWHSLTRPQGSARTSKAIMWSYRRTILFRKSCGSPTWSNVWQVGQWSCKNLVCVTSPGDRSRANIQLTLGLSYHKVYLSISGTYMLTAPPGEQVGVSRWSWRDHMAFYSSTPSFSNSKYPTTRSNTKL